MTLRHLADVSAADWFADDAASPVLRANLGPSCFESYVRVLHAESSPGNGDRWEGHLDDDLLRVLCEILARHTSTPDNCYFALWEGYGQIHGGDAVGFLIRFSGPTRWPGRIFTKEKPPPPVPPAFPRAVMEGPLLDFLGEGHFLFGGPLTDAGEWGAASYGAAIRRDINSPNLMWPADHAWFVTTNIESTWTGVGGTKELTDALLRDDRLEVVRTRYDEGALR